MNKMDYIYQSESYQKTYREMADEFAEMHFPESRKVEKGQTEYGKNGNILGYRFSLIDGMREYLIIGVSSDHRTHPDLYRIFPIADCFLE